MAIDFPSSPIVGQQFTAPNGVMYTWTGGHWTIVSPPPAGTVIQAGGVTSVPNASSGGGISSSNVQSALNELDAKKLAVAGGTMTGNIILAGDPVTASNPSQAATKNYVDQQVINAGGAVQLEGDVVGGPSTGLVNTSITNGAVTFVKLAAAAIASTAQFLGNAVSLLLTTDQVWAAAVPATLSGTVVTPTLNAGINFSWLLTGASTANNPLSMKPGQSGVFFLVQDSIGNRTVTWGNQYKFPGGVKPTLSTAPNAVDIISYVCRSASEMDCTFAGN